MRILFFLHNVSKARHFDGALEALADAGHSVVLAVARQRNRPAWLPKNLAQANRRLIAARQPGRIEVIPCPDRRVDAWRTAAPLLRQARDYMRFFDPRYAHADKLEDRSAANAPAGWVELVRGRPWIGRHWRALSRLLAGAEHAIPTDRLFDLFIAYEQPDVVLVTPLVDYGSYQTDYVKSAHRLGVPVVFAPFSWDNLTNRGLVRVMPDRVLAWNDGQKREAVELHGVDAGRIVVTGAARFDEFFAMSPSVTRDAFCAGLGLDPAAPLLLYLCSSEFVAPHEVDFVRRWMRGVRAAADPRLRNAAILVRPHPAHSGQWKGVSLSDLGHAALWTAPEGMNADQGLYDSLHHAQAVVGLNTSAMIEAGILGKACHTIVTDEFAGGQAQTLHFAHLRAANGGLLFEASGIPEHLTQLAASLGAQEAHRTQTRAFVQRFVRPRGMDLPVAPLVAEEIVRAAGIAKTPRHYPLWARPIDWAVRLAVAVRRSSTGRAPVRGRAARAAGGRRSSMGAESAAVSGRDDG